MIRPGHKDEQTDAALERALTGLRAVRPPDGLEQRLLARLDRPRVDLRSQALSMPPQRWIAAGLAVGAVALVVLLSVLPRTRGGAVRGGPVLPPAGPVVMSLDAARQALGVTANDGLPRVASSGNPTRSKLEPGPGVRPQVEPPQEEQVRFAASFPAPERALTEQEKMLMEYAVRLSGRPGPAAASPSAAVPIALDARAVTPRLPVAVLPAGFDITSALPAPLSNPDDLQLETPPTFMALMVRTDRETEGFFAAADARAKR